MPRASASASARAGGRDDRVSRAACLLSSHVDVPGAPAATRDMPAARLRTVRGSRKHVRVAARDEQDGDWPTRTDQWCWYCCHPFDTSPLPLPLQYDSKLDMFHVTGTFCGWPCIKAFNGASASYTKSIIANHITLLHRRCTGRLRGIRSAPPRQALRVFGGSMSIEQFREASRHDVEYCVLPPKMVLHTDVVHEQQHASRRAAAAQDARRPPLDLGQVVSFKDVDTRNETLRLKRPRPPQNDRNLLERTMGIGALVQTL